MKKLKIILLAVIIVLFGGVSYFGYSYYQLTQTVKQDDILIKSTDSALVQLFTTSTTTRVSPFTQAVYQSMVQISQLQAQQAPAK